MVWEAAAEVWEVVKGAVWIVCWEVAKTGGNAVLKRRSDRSDTKRKMIRDDLSAVADHVTECMAIADEYYAAESTAERRAELGRSIRRGLRELGIKVHTTNLGLREVGTTDLDQHLLIRFRQALSMEMDRADWRPVDQNDPMITAIYRAGLHVCAEIAKVKYRHA